MTDETKKGIRDRIWLKKTKSGHAATIGVFYPSLDKWMNYIIPIKELGLLTGGKKDLVAFNESEKVIKKLKEKTS